MVRAENVSSKAKAWNGIKCMLAIETPERKLWPQANIDTGTFGWRRVAFTVRVPTNATSATLVLGLEQVTGKVWFDDVKAVVGKPPISRDTKPVVGPAFTGHNLPRLRGAMISPNIDAEGLRVLGREWNVNLIRAPELWGLGFTGQGIVVGNQDTGFEWNHRRSGTSTGGGMGRLPTTTTTGTTPSTPAAAAAAPTPLPRATTTATAP